MDIQFPWDGETPSHQAIKPATETPKQDKKRGRRPVPAPRLSAIDWTYHHLTIIGPAPVLAEFQSAARGPGITPWRQDFDALEEAIFARAVGQRTLSVDGCRILARQFRDRVEAHHGQAMARTDRACPFDLHALVPVPARILQLGHEHPDALVWLRRHWGTERLRQVQMVPIKRRLKRGQAVAAISFFAYGGSPDAALRQLADHWPLAFDLRG